MRRVKELTTVPDSSLEAEDLPNPITFSTHVVGSMDRLEATFAFRNVPIKASQETPQSSKSSWQLRILAF